jgi:NADH-quinone oxidoreductase subunit M
VLAAALAVWLMGALSFGAPPPPPPAPPAAGQAVHPSGRIALSLPGGKHGPLVLGPGQGGWVGTLSILNVGPEPLIVSRIAIRGDEDDVRSPSRISARFVEGPATTATLAPGTSKDVVVSWMPDRDSRVHQAFGHVVVTSTDEEAGEVAMGFRAQMPTGLGWIGEHVLALLTALPLVVLLVVAAARLARRRDDPLVRTTAIALALLELLLALWAYQRFVPDIGKADGNDGFQLVERFVWVRSIGAELYLGVDGVSIALVLLTALTSLVAVVISPRPSSRSDGYFCALALLTSGVTGSLVALDMVVLFAAWQLALVALVLLVGAWGGARAEHAAAKLSVYGALGSGALLAVFVALSRASGRTLLVDGTVITHTMSIPELARTSFAARGPILGLPFVDVAWALLFVAIATATPLVPLHGWLPDALEEAPAGAAVFMAGAGVALGPYLLVRVGLGALPEGARWAEPSLAALGVLGVAYGSLCAMAQHSLRKFVAYASIASAGACLFGVAGFTPQGMAGTVTGLFAHGLSAAMLMVAIAALEHRVRSSDLARLAGVARRAPVLGLLIAVALALSLGVPGLAGFWGMLLVLAGGFARHPVLAVLLAASLVASAAAHVRVARCMLFERDRPAPLASAPVPVPDAAPRELAVLVSLAALALLLGVWPVPLLTQIAGGVRDAASSVDPAGSDPTMGPR